MGDIKVSIIIPTFNRVDFLKKAVESSLKQTYKNKEIIISDNASVDETSILCESFSKKHKEIKYFRNKTNIGMVKNWRKAMYDRSSGDYVIILSDDDYFIDNTFLEEAVKSINKYPNVLVVHADSEVYDLVRKKSYTNGVIRNIPFFMNGVNYIRNFQKYNPLLCSTLFHRETAIKLNAFNNKNYTSCDYQLFLKLFSMSNVIFIPSLVCKYLKHEGSITLNLNLEKSLKNIDFVFDVFQYFESSKVFNSKELRLLKRKILFFMLNSIFHQVLVARENLFFSLFKIIKTVPGSYLFLFHWKTLCRIILFPFPNFYNKLLRIYLHRHYTKIK